MRKEYKLESVNEITPKNKIIPHHYEVLSNEPQFHRQYSRMNSQQKQEYFFQQLFSTLISSLKHTEKSKKFSFNLDASCISTQFLDYFILVIQNISHRFSVPLRTLYQKINIEILEDAPLQNPARPILKKLKTLHVEISIDDINKQSSCPNMKKLIQWNIPHTLKIDRGTFWEISKEQKNINTFINNLFSNFNHTQSLLHSIVVEGVENNDREEKFKELKKELEEIFPDIAVYAQGWKYNPPKKTPEKNS